MPGVRQETPWSCGPAALEAVARHFGLDVHEGDLRHDLATPDAGTPPEALLTGARALGLDAEGREGWTLAQLERELILGHPVIVCLQAWGSRGAMAQGESGHWVVAIGREPRGLLFEDPALPKGERGILPRKELLEHWHDQDARGRRYERYGIVVRGRSSGSAVAA